MRIVIGSRPDWPASLEAAKMVGAKLRKAGHEPMELALDSRTLTKEIEKAEIAFVFGGDGTVHRHLGALVRLGVPVLVVPIGSGNDFARALELRRVRDSLEAWRKFGSSCGNVRTVDLGVITPVGAGQTRSHGTVHYFSCAAGVGLDGEIARRANALPRWLRGHGGYALSLAPALLRFRPFALKLSVLPAFRFATRAAPIVPGRVDAPTTATGRPGWSSSSSPC